MKEINIKVPEGYIIDKENSNLDKGTIAFKKENTLPNSWEEYINSLSPKKLIMVNTAINHLYCFPENIRCKYIALLKLELLRDVYRQGWKPDYDNTKEYKFNIVRFLNNNFDTAILSTITPHFLAFQSEKISNKFFSNFEDLIKQAEDLIN